MNRKALVITYHVKECIREGGFHKFINYLQEMSFDIDWLTCTMNSMWMFHKNDRENIKNFLTLWKGMKYQEGGSEIRHFAVPVWLPAKVAKYINPNLYNHYWASWKKIRKRLKNEYDVILVEGTGAQYAIELKKDYPNAKIIYRPSDILESFFRIPNAVDIEKRMIETANVTFCVDENQMKYYQKHFANCEKMKILRNPVVSEADIVFLQGYTIKEVKKKRVVYIGVSGVDLDLVEETAKVYRNVEFVIIGPFDKSSHENVIYTGALNSGEYEKYLEAACVGIQPMRQKLKNVVKYGYTKKIVLYMKYLLPIVATCSDNYLNIDGFYNAESNEEFIRLVGQALKFSEEEREALRKEYLEVLEVFLDKKCKEQLQNTISQLE